MMMYAKTMLALSVVLAFGTASAALANTQFDANFHPTAQHGALGAFAQQTTNRGVRPFTIEEKRWFDKAGRLQDPAD
jgi:hypothetical protein